VELADRDDQAGKNDGARDTGGNGRRVRSTRRREDVPELPRLPVAKHTIDRTYAGRYRPSLFLTLTLPSYGPVGPNGAPTDPGGYDYRRAARVAIHFGKLGDRFMAVEPQRRGAPHLLR
jgi:hypothetical protein